MELTQLIATGLCFLVGLSLGLLGGGGSILTVPVLVYVAGTSVKEAIAMSLIIVGVSSIIGSLRFMKQGFVNKRLVISFSCSGVPGAFLGTRLTPLFSERLLLIIFGGLMLVISIALLYNFPNNRKDKHATCNPDIVISIIAGAAIGLLTGFLGVGGGFMIVPAIVLLMKCSLQTAIGTSLVIIAINSLVGFTGHLSISHVNVLQIAMFLSAAIAGTFTGGRISIKTSTIVLQRLFVGLVFLVGSFLVVKNLSF